MRNWFGKDGWSKFEREIMSNVDKHGCHLNAVVDPDGHAPTFVYSVGFTKTMQKLEKSGFPEVIIFGLSGDYCAKAINELLALCAAGQELEEQARIEGFFGDYDGVVRMVHESNIVTDYFNSAIWYHPTQMNRELEKIAMLVWPDANGVFPWEDECEAWVRADQPALYEPRLNS